MASVSLDTSITVTPSIDEVERALKQLDSRLERRGLNAGLSAVALPIKRKIKATSPVQPGGGALKASIGQRQLKAGDKRRAGLPRSARAIFVGSTRKVPDTKYRRSPGKVIGQEHKALWLTEGTKPHSYFISRKRPLFLKGQFTVKIDHPGISKNPFIERAYNSELSRMDQRYVNAIVKFLDRF